MDVISTQTKVKKLITGFQVAGLEHCCTTTFASDLYRNDFNARADFLGNKLRAVKTMFAPLGGGRHNVSAAGNFGNNSNSNSSGGSNSNSNSNKKGRNKKWTNNKKDGKKAQKAGKTKAKRGKPATKFDPNNPDRRLTNKAWRELTEDQRNASRETHAKDYEDKDNNYAVESVNICREVTDVKVIDADVADVTAGVTAASLGQGGKAPALKEPVCININATQRLPSSTVHVPTKTLSYAKGTKGEGTTDNMETEES
jgi:hypothetical protein